MEKLEKATEQATKAANTLITEVQTLMNLFAGKITDESMTEVTQKFILARKVLSPTDLASQIAPYFMQFKSRVESGTPEDIQYMIDYDYTQLIKPNTVENTRSLIMSLTDNIKNVWRQNDERINAKIYAITERLVKLSDLFLRITTIIERTTV